MPGFYESKQPWMRKAFHSARMLTEEMMVNLVDGDSEEVQVSMEMDGNTDVNAINGTLLRII